MRLYACSLYDKKVAAYMPPMFFRTKGEGTRSFMDAVMRDENIRRHAEDYHFAYLGQFDDGFGTFEPVPGGPVVLMTALDSLTIDNQSS